MYEANHGIVQAHVMTVAARRQLQHLYFVFFGQWDTCTEVNPIAICKLSKVVPLVHVVANTEERSQGFTSQTCNRLHLSRGSLRHAAKGKCCELNLRAVESPNLKQPNI